jgi:cell division GTPase FtsZ
MRILAIGLGGAGGRIVDLLYRADRRSSKVACVEALVLDVDAESLSQLSVLPESSKIYFPPIDLANPRDSPDSSATTATIDIAEVTGRVHTMALGETDAIVICTGLGGGLVDVAPHIIAALRTSMVEPIFGLVTLPCLAEGERCSAKAADDIETLSPLLDGVVIFDNETWYKKIKSQKKTLAREELSFAARIGLKKKPDQILSPAQRVYASLNEVIVRRISLILRAGEFKADGGLELAEVVLDAGEVLNTMRGMGFITIGYAVEQLPHNPLNFLKKWRPTGFFADEHQKKASRIVELAKQAIYHDVSAPCDLTSAEKALILIAGPSHELSMKGYMTVRKWIDRSIAGLETRSGDYPVTSTRFVAIIVMLTGLKNIPRIEELKQIRTQYKKHLAGEKAATEEIVSEEGFPPEKGVAASSRSSDKPLKLRDQMISLPKKKYPGEYKGGDTGIGDSPYPSITTGLDSPLPVTTGSQGEPAETSTTKTGTDHRRRVIVAKPHEPGRATGKISTTGKETAIPVKKILASHSPLPSQEKTLVALDDRNKLKEKERKKIERELQKQRLMAMTGKDPKFDRDYRKTHVTESSSQPPRQAVYRTEREELNHVSVSTRQIHKKEEMQKIVLHKKKAQTDHASSPTLSEAGENPPESTTLDGERRFAVESIQNGNNDTIDEWIKQASYRKKDGLFEGESFKLKDASPTVSDDALLHTDLKRARTLTGSTGIIKDITQSESARERDRSFNKTKRKTDEDITWVS